MAPAPSTPSRAASLLLATLCPRFNPIGSEPGSGRGFCTWWRWRAACPGGRTRSRAGAGAAGQSEAVPAGAPSRKRPAPSPPRLRWHLKNLGNQENSAAEKAARWEPLLPEEPGFLEAEAGEDTARISQRQIADAADIGSAAKHFELRLEQFGPYRLDYTRNGRHLVLGGQRGHVAALDWAQRRLLSEFNVLEPVRDLRWLHSESLLAVAQRRWLHVYDSQGLEIHVLRAFQGVLRLEFLPYHFLLAAVSELGLLHFLDVSVGAEVATLRTRSGRAGAMAQSPRQRHRAPGTRQRSGNFIGNSGGFTGNFIGNSG
ncbi:WD repeat-containing protein 46, partial [Passer domesticus]|uniref:WD repeat-containing protein 46 n=1 Tax=Passer domesticus TaxID=48849 RepID=UPI0030FE949B